mmetsp:Transcript_28363/g.81637  ORF Transcript_28363/g.81637 Transcript_28363/m.81637 type:complete len:170 (-) Transcript_28363:11-520(-)
MTALALLLAPVVSRTPPVLNQSRLPSQLQQTLPLPWPLLELLQLQQLWWPLRQCRWRLPLLQLPLPPPSALLRALQVQQVLVEVAAVQQHKRQQAPQQKLQQLKQQQMLLLRVLLLPLLRLPLPLPLAPPPRLASLPRQVPGPSELAWWRAARHRSPGAAWADLPWPGP